MKNIYNGITSILALAAVLSAWYLSGLPSGHATGPGVWDIAPGVALLLGTGFIIYAVSNNIAAGSNPLAPLVWFVLATASPAALTFSPILAATPLVAASIALLLAFCTVKPSLEYITFCFITLGTAAILLPPLIWLSPIYFVSAIARTESKARTVVASILAIVIPLAFWCGIRFLVADAAAAENTLRTFAEGTITLHLLGTGASAPTIARLAMTVLVTVIALVIVIRRLDSYTIAQYHVANRMLLLLPAMTALAILFFGGQPWELLTALPASFFIDEYAAHPIRPRNRTLAFIVLGLLLIAERIYLYL